MVREKPEKYKSARKKKENTKVWRREKHDSRLPFFFVFFFNFLTKVNKNWYGLKNRHNHFDHIECFHGSWVVCESVRGGGCVYLKPVGM